MVKIGNVKIKTNVFLAPLSGCTDLSFRLISREHGAGFCFFEMIDSNSLIHNHPKTQTMLKTNKKDWPIAAQLLGSDPTVMTESAQRLSEILDLSFIDINAACPVKKVLKKKSGAYLLKDVKLLSKIINKMSKNLKLPITVKIRIVEDIKQSIHISKKCEDSGASCIFVHGRTQREGYRGIPNYSAIRDIKKNVKIPVFGSGNILTPELAKKMFVVTNCDGILVARGALGNPWIFKDIKNNRKPSKAIAMSLKKKTLKKHLSYIEKYKETKLPAKIGLMRKVAMWYLKSLFHASKIRREICFCKNYEDLIGLIDKVSD